MREEQFEPAKFEPYKAQKSISQSAKNVDLPPSVRKCSPADFSIHRKFSFVQSMERTKSTARITDCPYLKTSVVHFMGSLENTTFETTKILFPNAKLTRDGMKNILSAIGKGLYGRM